MGPQSLDCKVLIKQTNKKTDKQTNKKQFEARKSVLNRISDISRGYTRQLYLGKWEVSLRGKRRVPVFTKVDFHGAVAKHPKQTAPHVD